jgi:CheY-specific phosphatase CheX
MAMSTLSNNPDAVPEQALPEPLLGQLRDSVQQVLSTMVDARCDGCEGAHGEQLRIQAMVDFHGAHAGTLSLACDDDGAASLARGLLMLAPEDPIAPEEIEDAIKECANMVAGVLKTRAFGADGDARLSVPRLAVAPLANNDGLWWRVQAGALVVGLRRAS